MRKPSAADDKKSSNTDNAEQVLYVYAYNDELNLGTRTYMQGKKKITEPSYALEVPTECADSDPVVAHWPDETLAILPGVSAAKIRAASNKISRKGEGVLFEATMKDTKHKITIMQRVDRKLLLSLYEQQMQRLSVNLDVWGKIEDQHVQLCASDPILQQGLAYLKPFAEDYAAGKVARAELKSHRDSQMKREGLMDASGRQKPFASRQATSSSGADPSHQAPLPTPEATRPASTKREEPQPHAKRQKNTNGENNANAEKAETGTGAALKKPAATTPTAATTAASAASTASSS